jgi:hypothetical protein
MIEDHIRVSKFKNLNETIENMKQLLRHEQEAVCMRVNRLYEGKECVVHNGKDVVCNPYQPLTTSGSPVKPGIKNSIVPSSG